VHGVITGSRRHTGGINLVDLLDLIDLRLLLVVIAGIMVFFLIMLIVMWSKLNKLRKNYTAMLNGNGNMNIEEAIIDLQSKAGRLKGKTEDVEQQLRNIVEHMKIMKSNIGVHRYNAFAQSGSDLSFSVAFMDDNQDGVVLTGIHNREETYVYAKPLVQGQSQYTLSPEEKEAILRCQQKK
jgi:hypothetical protein